MSGTLQATVLKDGASSTNNITLDASGNATIGNNLTVTGTLAGNPTTTGTVVMGSSFLRNRIINGAMQISQRGTSFSTPASGAYTIDRWFIGWIGAAPATVAQVSNSAGYRNAFQATGAASNTVLSINQRIESYNCSDLSGATVTFQANITVSTPQTVSWSLSYPTAQDNYTSSTTISTGTWSATATATTFTATITSLPAGAVNGLQLAFYPNNGGAFTSGTITITGVQLEVGSVATPFERRLYGQELMLCQRYLPAFSGNNVWFPWAIATSTTTGYFTVIYPVQTRTAPTGLVYSSLSHFNATDIVGLNSVTTAITFNTSSNMSGIHQWSVASGATTGRTSTIYSVNASALIYFTGCEL